MLQHLLLEADQQPEQQEPPEGMFWQMAHHTFEGFPALCSDITKSAIPGQRVGPLLLDASVIGKGSYSKVFRATNCETGQQDVVKVMSKSRFRKPDAVRLLWLEMRLLACMEHPGVVKSYGVFHGPRHIFIHMECAGPHNLFKAIRLAGDRLPLQRTRRLFAQLLDAVSYCHANDVAHRDLKPENVAVSECGTHIKVVDFGSTAPASSPCTEVIGTMPFVAPEVLAACVEAPYFPNGADVWSCGVLLLEMLCGIDKLNRMLSWARSQKPSRACRDDILRFFERPGALAEAVREDVGDLGADFHTLVHGVLDPHPAGRRAVAQAFSSKWLQGA